MDDFEKLINTLMASKADVAHAVAVGTHKAGELIAKDAKSNCPIDTGYLRNSINTVTVPTPTGARTTVGTAVEYAPYVEYGTGQRGDQSVAHRQDWLGMPPSPFLRPAVYSNQDNIGLIIREEVGRVFKK